MILALSACSAQGLWLLADPKTLDLVAQVSWTDDQSTGLSASLAKHFRCLLFAADIHKEDISQLFVVSGPGAFTGLRMSAAFMQGLARALNKPVVGVPTYDLLGESFYIPTRHQMAKGLGRTEALHRGLEFLHLQSRLDSQLQQPTEDERVLGFKDHPNWPSPAELLSGIRRNLHSSEKRQPLSLIYGLEPKISGQR